MVQGPAPAVTGRCQHVHEPRLQQQPYLANRSSGDSECDAQDKISHNFPAINYEDPKVDIGTTILKALVVSIVFSSKTHHVFSQGHHFYFQSSHDVKIDLPIAQSDPRITVRSVPSPEGQNSSCLTLGPTKKASAETVLGLQCTTDLKNQYRRHV